MITAVHAFRPGIQGISQQRRGLFFLLGLAFAIKVAMLVLLADKPPNVDGIRYLRAAQELDAGHFSQALSIYPMPAYPLLIVMAKWLAQDWLLAARLLSIAALLVATWLLYRITEHLFDRKAAFWATLVFALMPFQNEMGVLVYRDPVYLAVFAWAILLMLKAFDDPRPWAIAAAAWVGCGAALFRIEGIFLTPVFLGVVVIAAAAAADPDRRRRLLTGVAAWVAMAALVVGVFLVFDGARHVGLGRLDQVWHRVSALGHENLLRNYTRIHEGLKAIEAASPVPSQNMNFGEIASSLFWLIYFIGLLQLFVQILGAVNLLPLVMGMQAERTRARVLLWAIFGAYLALLYVSLVETDFSGDRFVFAAAFLLYPWVGEGLSRLVFWISRRTRRVGLWLLFYGAFIVSPLVATAGLMKTEDLSAVAAGRWLAQSPYRHAKIVGNDTRIAFEAGIPLYLEPEQYRHFNPESRDFSDVERVATESHSALIFLKIRKTRLDRLPKFSRYREIERFTDEDKIVFVFAAPGAIDSTEPIQQR